MTFKQAQKEGWQFTGMSWDRYWNSYNKKESDYKAEAARIKKVFKGADYRIVTGGKNSWLGPDAKAIMGNEIFCKFQYFDFDSTFSAIEKFPKQVQELREKYQKELDALVTTQKQKVELYNEACRISGKRLQISPETYLQTDETVL